MKLTPAQQQYFSLKATHKDCLLLFRIGDFYEMFYEDAHIAHRILDITLTSRDKSAENPIPLAGIPYHALEKYLPRLIKAGYKVALAEQIGEVISGKVVERQVTRIITAGTYIEQNVSGEFLCAITMTNLPDIYHCGLMEVTTGKLHTLSFDHRDDLIKYILKHSPREVVMDIDLPERLSLEKYLHSLLQCSISISDLPQNLLAFLQHHLQVSSLDGYGKALSDGRERVFGLLGNYLLYTIKQKKLFFTDISYGFPKGIVHLDDTTVRNLELFSSSYEQKSQHSLFALIDVCHTTMGSRLLMDRLQYPHNEETFLQQQHRLYDVLEAHDTGAWNNFLKQIPDIPKIFSLLTYKGAQASKLQQLRNLGDLLLETGPVQSYLRSLLGEEYRDKSRQVFLLLTSSIISSQSLGDQGYIEEGYDEEIDRLRQLVFHTDDVLLSYQKELVEKTGISSVRLKYVEHQGYFLEISKQYQQQFEASLSLDDEKFDFSRRSTLKTGERYGTSYLSGLESRILEAKDALAQRQQILLDEICKTLLEHQSLRLAWADSIAEHDLVSSHLQFAREHHRVRPDFCNTYEILGGRHPLVESFLGSHEQFIANDLTFSSEDCFHCITGPNMGGKTTYLKQNALIVLLAHAGLYVPASSAKIRFVDAIFARIGTGDILAKQQSTFMTEMIEMANILHNATKESFLVLDEIGRGTSTYDGLALARAICEYIVTNIKAKTLFATHYHELVTLEKEFQGFHNYCVSVYESNEDIVFLKKIVKGAINKSYGIHVAERASLPLSIIASAQKYLKTLETFVSRPTLIQTSLFQTDMVQKSHITEIERSLESIDTNTITPLQALVYLNELKNMLQ